MENPSEAKKITIRTAPGFGYQLASNLGVRLEKENVPPSRWPLKFPVTFKQITKLPEVGKNAKVVRKIIEAAQAIWKDMREHAIEIEKDMILHPEYYDMLDEVAPKAEQPSTWRLLSIEIEQIEGNVYVTQYEDEDSAKANVYKILGARNLKKCVLEFEDDYANFINEVREAIRATKDLLPSIRLELICLLGVNQKVAKRAPKPRVKRSN